MKKAILVLCLLIAALGCNALGNSPTDPGVPEVELSAQFRCLLTNFNATLQCSDTSTGGKPPYVYDWRADFRPPQLATSSQQVVFNFSDDCRALPAGQVLVATVTMTITDRDRKQDTSSAVFRLCSVAL